MWNAKLLPIIFIINIKIPPKIEFKINLKIFFNGTIKIFPKINRKIIQDKKASILLMSKYITSGKVYDITWTNITVSCCFLYARNFLIS